VAKIVGIVTTRRNGVDGGAPIFYAENLEQLQQTAFLLEKILDCAAHSIDEDLFILVDRN